MRENYCSIIDQFLSIRLSKEEVDRVRFSLPDPIKLIEEKAIKISYLQRVGITKLLYIARRKWSYRPEPILPNFHFSSFPIFDVKLESLKQMKIM